MSRYVLKTISFDNVEHSFYILDSSEINSNIMIAMISLDALRDGVDYFYVKVQIGNITYKYKMIKSMDDIYEARNSGFRNESKITLYELAKKLEKSNLSKFLDK